MATTKTILALPLVCLIGALAGIVWAIALYARVTADLFCFAVGSVDLWLAARAPRVLWKRGRQ